MKNPKIFLIAFLAVTVFFTSCKKDKDVEPEPLKVLIMGAVSHENYLVDVMNKIDSTNLFGVVDTFNVSNHLPTLALLNEYDAVFVFTDDDPADSEVLGDTLAAYIEAGGGVVNATFCGNVSIIGGFTPYALYTETDQDSGEERVLGSVTDDQHPIMKNIASFNGGVSSYINNLGTVDPAATVLAKYDNDEPLIIIKENVGTKNAKRVFVNFYPPSKDARDDFWDPTTDGALIMGNSLVWVAN